MNTHLYKCSHNLVIPMQIKFNDDIFARFLVIMKSVILFIKEYRGPPFRPSCDVIDDVIIMKNTFSGITWADLFISEVKLKLCLIFIFFFKMAVILSSRQTFLPEIPKVECTRKITISISDILSF